MRSGQAPRLLDRQAYTRVWPQGLGRGLWGGVGLQRALRGARPARWRLSASAPCPLTDLLHIQLRLPCDQARTLALPHQRPVSIAAAWFWLSAPAPVSTDTHAADPGSHRGAAGSPGPLVAVARVSRGRGALAAQAARVAQRALAHGAPQRRARGRALLAHLAARGSDRVGQSRIAEPLHCAILRSCLRSNK